MYKLPTDFDPNVYVGKSLTSVLFSENTVTFNFGIGLWIHVYNGFDLKSTGGTIRFMFLSGEPPRIEPKVGEALGHVVTEIEVFDERTLRVTFDNGFVLDVLGDVENYECYELLIEGRTIIV